MEPAQIRKCVRVNKAEQSWKSWRSKEYFTPDMGLLSWEFTWLGLGLAFDQYFLTVPPSLCFRMVIHILCHYVGSIGSAFWLYFYNGITGKRLPCVSKETLDFETSLR